MAVNQVIMTRRGAAVNYYRIMVATLNHNQILDCILQSFVSRDFCDLW